MCIVRERMKGRYGHQRYASAKHIKYYGVVSNYIYVNNLRRTRDPEHSDPLSRWTLKYEVKPSLISRIKLLVVN
jgi:hypothetical protein